MSKVVRKRKAKPLPECCICLNPIEKKDEARITSCRHRYHHECIRKWTERDNTCPQCRRRYNYIINIQKKKRERVYRPVPHIDEHYHLAYILYCFFNEEEFREVLRNGVEIGNDQSTQIFRFLREILDRMRQEDRYPSTLNEDSREEAYTWLDNITEDLLRL